MKVLLRRVSLLTVCFICFLIFSISSNIEAEDSSENSGKMQLKIDRIGKDEEQEYKNIETELEKKFPNLFKEETRALIKSKQTEEEELAEELEQSLFTMEGEADNTLKDTKESLFNTDYTAPKASANNVHEEEGNAISKALYLGLTGLATVLCGGIYIMIRKWVD